MTSTGKQTHKEASVLCHLLFLPSSESCLDDSLMIGACENMKERVVPENISFFLE